MSGTETEAAKTAREQAIDAGYTGIGKAVSSGSYTVEKLAAAAYDAMREIIAREVIAGVCRREGHDETEITTYADLGNIRRFVCARCGARRAEPYDKWANGELVMPPQRPALHPGEQIVTEGGDRARG